MADLERFKQVKAVVADWDDTIVGTLPKVVEIVDGFADILGVGRPGEAGLIKFWGRTVEEIIHGLFGAHRPHISSQELFQQYIASVPKDYCPYPLDGIEPAVTRLHQMGYIQGIVSSGPREGILRGICTHYPSLESVYTFIHGADDTPARKPDPRAFDPAFEILRSMGITEGETVYVGDFHGDYEAAVARGMLFLGIEAHHKSREWFIQKGLEEELRLPSFAAVPRFLEAINRR